jgi:PHD/YefM family antitoxin component YafN of YafNO toxin-antitoxin module
LIEETTTLSPELKPAIEKADDQPVRVEDPETQTASVIIREDDYHRLRNTVPESDLTLHEFEELRTRQKGTGSDELIQFHPGSYPAAGDRGRSV